MAHHASTAMPPLCFSRSRFCRVNLSCLRCCGVSRFCFCFCAPRVGVGAASWGRVWARWLRIACRGFDWNTGCDTTAERRSRSDTRILLLARDVFAFASFPCFGLLGARSADRSVSRKASKSLSALDAPFRFDLAYARGSRIPQCRGMGRSAMSSNRRERR